MNKSTNNHIRGSEHQWKLKTSNKHIDIFSLLKTGQQGRGESARAPVLDKVQTTKEC